MRSAAAAFALAAVLSACSSAPEEKRAPAPAIPDAVRQYLREKLFQGQDPPASAVTELRAPGAVMEHVTALVWEKGQVERFTKDRWYGLVRCADGTVHAVHFRGGKLRNDVKLDEGRERVVRRLYSGEAFTAPPAPELAAWRAKDRVDAAAVFEATVSRLGDFRGRIDDATIERARKNLLDPATRTDELARALGALADSKPAPELCRAGLWVLSRMDGMEFQRANADGSAKDPAASISDLRAVDAQTFYENVFYAVKARGEFPWGAEVSDHDFLQHALSPRQSGEPLQRWRRYFYEAIAPEVRGLGRDRLDRAIEIATSACYDFFQYEGDTTWEDFGMLTALAVHEGRCEDCSNVENAMLGAIAIPGSQAFTPWWGHANGNHAWTWIPGFGKSKGDGAAAVKVYTKTWDGLEDVTEQHTPVTRIEVPTGAKEGQAELLVWNSDDWRRIARTPVQAGKVAFEKVGCRRDFAVMVRIPGEPDRLFGIAKGGAVAPLSDAELPEAGFEVVFDKMSPLGEFQADRDCSVEVWTGAGWKARGSARVSTGALKFAGAAGHLFRLKGEGLSDRPFTVESQAGEVVISVR